jgi:hypothetical protein
MTESVERFKEIRRTENIKSAGRFIDKGIRTTIPPKSKVAILLDNKTHTTGYPSLFVSKGKGAKIKITYAESLFKDMKASTTGSAFDGPGNEDPKGNRNEIDGKKIFGYYDVIFPDGGLNRSFRTLSRKTFGMFSLISKPPERNSSSMIITIIILFIPSTKLQSSDHQILNCRKYGMPPGLPLKTVLKISSMIHTTNNSSILAIPVLKH